MHADGRRYAPRWFWLTNMELDRAVKLMKSGLELATQYVKDGAAVGIKTGRPHYPVSDEVWAASNEIMEYGFTLAADIDCAVQLHTESVGEPELVDITERQSVPALNSTGL